MAEVDEQEIDVIKNLYSTVTALLDAAPVVPAVRLRCELRLGRLPRERIRTVVGFAPGGGADQYARLVRERMARSLGRPVVIENRPGAGATVAAAYVAKARPAGYTLLLGATSEIAAMPVLRPSVVRYKVPQDFAFVRMMFEAGSGIVVDANSSIHNWEDFVAPVQGAGRQDRVLRGRGPCTVHHGADRRLARALG